MQNSATELSEIWTTDASLLICTAMQIVQKGGDQLPRLTARVQQSLQVLQTRFAVEFVWTPSHGKRLPWIAHSIF